MFNTPASERGLKDLVLPCCCIAFEYRYKEIDGWDEKDPEKQRVEASEESNRDIKPS